MIAKVRKVLAERPAFRIQDAKLKVSAVLVPLFRKDGQYHILFIQRTDRVKEHKGQISFPGGAYEKTDKTIMKTALREAQEEIGLAPDDVEVLGQLDDLPTVATNYVISPFVGLIPYPYKFELDKWETEELIEVPINALLDKSCGIEEQNIIDDKEVGSYSFKYGDKIIWGATARILQQFLEIVAN